MKKDEGARSEARARGRESGTSRIPSIPRTDWLASDLRYCKPMRRLVPRPPNLNLIVATLTSPSLANGMPGYYIVATAASAASSSSRFELRTFLRDMNDPRTFGKRSTFYDIY